MLPLMLVADWRVCLAVPKALEPDIMGERERGEHERL